MPKTIPDALEAHARLQPDKLCVADRKQALSYGEMLRRIKAVAKYLTDRGVRKGDIVALRASQSVEYAAGFYGIQFCGAVVCPIEKTAAAERTQSVLAQLSARFILDLRRYELPGVSVLDLREAFGYGEAVDAQVPVESGDIADIIFTTGTTGDSKGILISYATDLAIAENVIDSVSMTADEVEFITSLTSHSLAIRRMNAAMYIGSSVVLSENYILYQNFWGLIEKYRVTAFTFVPAILSMILEVYGDKLGEYNGQLNYIQLGSAPLHESTKEKLIRLLPSTRLYNTYGVTESGCTIILEFSRYRDKKGCIGRTTVNTTLLFANESRDGFVEARDEASAGYMAFRGPMNMTGYLNAPEKTREVSRNGVIFTNDLGYVGGDGLVYFLGRAGEVINTGGLKVNPIEVEGVVGDMDGVADCACVPMKDGRRGEVPKLFVVLEAGSALTEKEIRAYVRQRLEDYKVPEKVVQIDEIPRTFNGKIIRRKLIEME